jgi:hypothetical protein
VANTLVGAEGWDRIEGRDGADWLRGDGGNDTIDGGSGDDTIDGGSGNDTINGGSGADFVQGGLGADTLTGGAEAAGAADADTFYYASWSEFGDTITDFEHGVDKIDVSAIDARPDIAGNQAFTFDATPDGAWEERTDGLDQGWPIMTPAKVTDPNDTSSINWPFINGDPGEIEFRHKDGFTAVYLSLGDGYELPVIVLEGHITLTASDFIL